MSATPRTVMWKKQNRQRFANKGLNTAPNHQLAEDSDSRTLCGDPVPAKDSGFTVVRGEPHLTCSLCIERMPEGSANPRTRKAPKLTHDALQEQIRKFKKDGGTIQKLPDQAGERSGLVRVDDLKHGLGRGR